ncbi:capsid assembly scaffolding protein Gp46 family protein [Clostridium culturomicium]|uniref:capsid assembly scaffolding protein Gp46 family protein n=1 Tax=Clostridium culturomicium TaxID=1499683 RepID=UPI00058FD64F|nr:DUF4355 domain-containing protein [Clostridium culturomicium]
MIKSELLKLIEGIGDDQDVIETLKKNEEIKSLAKDFDVTKLALEDFTKLLQENPTIKGYWTSEKDRAVTKGIDSFKTNNLQKLIDEAVKAKFNEGLTPEQIALKEMESKYQALEKQIKMKELESKYKDTLNEKGLDTRLMKYILSENEDDIITNIDLFTEIISSTTNLEVNKRLNDASYKPPKNDITPKTMTKQELLNKGYAYANKFANEHPDEYKQIMES